MTWLALAISHTVCVVYNINSLGAALSYFRVLPFALLSTMLLRMKTTTFELIQNYSCPWFDASKKYNLNPLAVSLRQNDEAGVLDCSAFIDT